MALKTTLEDAKDRLDALLTYANGVTGESDTSIGDAIETLADGYGQGGSSLPIQLDLLGTWSGTLAEYTNTSTWESTDTGIEISTLDTKYLYFVVTISCDGTLDTSNANNWGGLTISFGTRYRSNKGFLRGGQMWTRGSGGLTWDSLVSDVQTGSSYGVILGNNTANITLMRKAHGTGCPKIMGGNYTVRVYGITAI